MREGCLGKKEGSMAVAIHQLFPVLKCLFFKRQVHCFPGIVDQDINSSEGSDCNENSWPHRGRDIGFHGNGRCMQTGYNCFRALFTSGRRIINEEFGTAC